MNRRVKRLALFISFSAACLGSSYSAIAADPAATENTAPTERARPPLDFTPPVVTLNGDAVMSLYQGTTYLDPGATAMDAVDGSIRVTVRGSPIMSRPGTYTITYSAVDRRGNKGTARRTVHVIADTLAPVITLNGLSSMSIIQGSIFEDLGATATDNLDGEVAVRVLGRVRRNIPGIYTLTYVAKDEAGNEARVTRTVTVIADTVPPQLTLNGSDTITLTKGTAFNDPGAQATDNSDAPVRIRQYGRVNTDRLGTYLVRYQARDGAGNLSTVLTRTVIVVASTPTDTIAPVITLNGNTSIELTVGDTYNELGATATDNVDPNVTVTTSGSVDTTTAGNYTITYTAQDSAGNTSTLTRLVVVKPRANVAPTANAGGDQTANELTTVTLSGSGTDTDGSIATYAWTQTEGATVSLTNANSAQASFSAPDVAADTELTFKLIVTDDDGATAEDTVAVTVKAVDNTKPVIALFGDTHVELTVGDAYVEAGATATDDIDGSINVTTTGSVDTTTAGTYTIHYDATDAAGNAADTVTRHILVKAANVLPTVDAGIDQEVNEATTVNLNGNANDPDGTIINYAWVQMSGPEVDIANVDKAQASFTAPDVSENTTLTFRFTVTDSYGDSADDSVSIIVKPLDNTKPVITLLGDTDVELTVGDNYVDAGATATDNIDSTVTVTATGSVNTSLVGTYTITYTAQDSAGNQANPVTRTITVKAANAAPTANAGEDQTANELTTVTLSGSGTDTDGTVASYAWTQTGGATVSLTNANSAQASFSAPDVAETTELTFKLTVTDDKGATAEDTVTITVQAITGNIVPTANAGDPQKLEGDQSVSLDGSNSADPDGSIVSYEWTQISGNLVALNDSTTVSPSFTTPVMNAGDADQVLLFKLKVTDNEGASAESTTTVTVKYDATEPTMYPYGPNPTEVIIGDAYTDAGAYAWDNIDGELTPSVSGTVDTNVLGDYTLTYTATDAAGNTATTTRTVKVINTPNIEPVATIGASQRVDGETTVTLDGSGSTDSDGAITSYAWTQITGTPVVLSNAGTSQANFLAPSSTEDQTLTFKLVVTDDREGSSEKTTFVQIKGTSTTVTPVKLNDTGITLCASATSNTLSCETASYGNQDAQVGRDFTHDDNSDGHAGFSFTKLDTNGQALLDQTVSYTATPWSCVKDNVTGLTWEIKTDDNGLHDVNWTYSWYNPNSTKNGGNPGQASTRLCTTSGDPTTCDTLAYIQTVNAQNLCGANDWRLPSVEEMTSLFHYNYNKATSAINDLDRNYFPYIKNSYYWSSSPKAGYFNEPSDRAWAVYFRTREMYGYEKSSDNPVILVRGSKY